MNVSSKEITQKLYTIELTEEEAKQMMHSIGRTSEFGRTDFFQDKAFAIQLGTLYRELEAKIVKNQQLT